MIFLLKSFSSPLLSSFEYFIPFFTFFCLFLNPPLFSILFSFSSSSDFLFLYSSPRLHAPFSPLRCPPPILFSSSSLLYFCFLEKIRLISTLLTDFLEDERWGENRGRQWTNAGSWQKEKRQEVSKRWGRRRQWGVSHGDFWCSVSVRYCC